MLKFSSIHRPGICSPLNSIPLLSQQIAKRNLRKPHYTFRSIEETKEIEQQQQQQQQQEQKNLKSSQQGLPQIFIWAGSLLVVIGIFYSVVFYAGAGFFYLVKDSITFTKKDFIPYSERLEMERKAQQEYVKNQDVEPSQEISGSQDADLLQLLPSKARK